MTNKPIACGLDLGSKTCGVAVSDGLGLFAHPVTTLYYSNQDSYELLEQLDDLIQEHKIELFVLGLPKMMNNDLGPRAQLSIEFKAILEETFNLPVVLMDERLSTVSSLKKLSSLEVNKKKKKKVIDQVAAVEILQRYLDQRRGEL